MGEEGPPRRLVGPRANIKCGARNMDCVREGAGGTPPGNVEILHALKCVLEASEAPFCVCIQYIHTCKLPSSFSSFRHTGWTVQ